MSNEVHIEVSTILSYGPLIIIRSSGDGIMNIIAYSEDD